MVFISYKSYHHLHSFKKCNNKNIRSNVLILYGKKYHKLNVRLAGFLKQFSNCVVFSILKFLNIFVILPNIKTPFPHRLLKVITCLGVLIFYTIHTILCVYLSCPNHNVTIEEEMSRNKKIRSIRGFLSEINAHRTFQSNRMKPPSLFKRCQYLCCISEGLAFFY